MDGVALLLLLDLGVVGGLLLAAYLLATYRGKGR